MQRSQMFTALFAVVLAVAAAWSPPLSDAGARFEDFERRFRRQYASAEERERRFNIFEDNLRMIDTENAKDLPYKLGVTDFADLKFAEFKGYYLKGINGTAVNGLAKLGVFQAPEGFTEPASVDWVTKGGVTAVKNQGQCGSCWAFSTAGALEGASFVAGRPLPNLSEQNVLDCDNGGNRCQGGSMDQAFEWVQQSGICAEADYSYKCSDQSSLSCKSSMCSATCTQVLGPGDVTGHTDVDHTEGALEAAVAQQPVSVAIEADKSVFQHYVSGILTNSACGSKLDHGVLAVGYGIENGQMYWKVKNSWGTTFGEEGYIRIEKGSALAGGECGIRKMASFPTVKSAGPSPGPSPSPPPGPSPSPGCADVKVQDFCKFVKSDGDCSILAKDCLQTCGCCGPSPPTFCEGRNKSTPAATSTVQVVV